MPAPGQEALASQLELGKEREVRQVRKGRIAKATSREKRQLKAAKLPRSFIPASSTPLALWASMLRSSRASALRPATWATLAPLMDSQRVFGGFRALKWDV